jgi:hypothetical protein
MAAEWRSMGASVCSEFISGRFKAVLLPLITHTFSKFHLHHFVPPCIKVMVIQDFYRSRCINVMYLDYIWSRLAVHYKRLCTGFKARLTTWASHGHGIACPRSADSPQLPSYPMSRLTSPLKFSQLGLISP